MKNIKPSNKSVNHSTTVKTSPPPSCLPCKSDREGSVFGALGLFVLLIGSGAVYALISKNRRAKNMYWAQILAIAFGHAVGFFAVVKAPWASPLLVGAALVINLFVVVIFTALGKR